MIQKLQNPLAVIHRARLSWALVAGLAMVGDVTAAAHETVLRPARRTEVTPSAVSRQERWKGFPCFMGVDGRAITLKPGGPDSRRIAAGHSKDAPLPFDWSGALTNEGRPAGAAASAAQTTATPGRFAATHVDTLRVAMIRIDFETDRSGDSTTTLDGRFDLRTEASLPVDPPPHNQEFYAAHGTALSNYYRAQSDGHLELAVSVFPPEASGAYRLGDTADYGPWSVVSDNVDVALEAEALIKDGLNAAVASGDIDLQQFDAFILVHAGSDFQSDFNGDSPNDIPTFVLEFGDTVIIGGQLIDRCMVIPETTTQDGFFGAINGVLAHEFGHILGLVDLYNVRSGLPMVGYFSVMDSGHNIGAIINDTDSTLVDVFGLLPSSFDAWSRIQLFLSPESPGGGFLGSRVSVVEESLATQLGSVLLEHELVYAPIHDTEYYLIENRQIDLDGNGFPIIRADATTGVILGPIADSTLTNPDGALEYDALLPSGGLLVWHVDDRVLFGDLRDPAGINTNINRRGVKLIEADAIEDQGRRNFGTPWDPFYAGNNSFFGPFSLPATTTNDGQFSRIEIGTTSEPNVVMDVTVNRRAALDGWPIFLNDAITITSTGLLDVTGDGSPEMLFTFGSNILAVEGRGGRPYPPLDENGQASSWVRGPAGLDRRLASGSMKDPRPQPPAARLPFVAALTVGADQIVAWEASGTEIPTSSVRRLNQASTPPALINDDRLSDQYSLAYGSWDGRVHLAGGLAPLERRADSEAFQFNGEPDPPYGTVLVGALRGSTSSIDVAWATESGRVHMATVDERQLNPSPGPDGTRLMTTIGSTPEPVGGRRRLSLVAADFRGSEPGAYDLAAIDRTGTITLVDLSGTTLPGWPVILGTPLVGGAAAGDLDGEGNAELVVADTLGMLSVLNGDGSMALHFPLSLGSKPTSGAMMANIDGEPGHEILLMTEDGSLHAINRLGKESSGFPIGLGGYRMASNYLADLDHDGIMDIVAGSTDHLLAGFSTGQAIPDSLIAWRGEDNGPTRNAILDRRVAGVGRPTGPSAEAQSLVCFPNPARGDRMNFRMTLAEGQSASASVFDLTGRPVVNGLSPTGSDREANIPWNLADVAPGIYLVRVEVSGPGAPETLVRMVSVLR